MSRFAPAQLLVGLGLDDDEALEEDGPLAAPAAAEAPNPFSFRAFAASAPTAPAQPAAALAATAAAARTTKAPRDNEVKAGATARITLFASDEDDEDDEDGIAVVALAATAVATAAATPAAALAAGRGDDRQAQPPSLPPQPPPPSQPPPVAGKDLVSMSGWPGWLAVVPQSWAVVLLLANTRLPCLGMVESLQLQQFCSQASTPATAASGAAAGARPHGCRSGLELLFFRRQLR
jgi:hypothetical protein